MNTIANTESAFSAPSFEGNVSTPEIDSNVGTAAPKPKSKRGFASLSPEKRKEISSKGGKKAHEVGTAHQFNSEEARKAGRLGGIAPHKSRGRAVKAPVSGVFVK